jgi:type II secretory pathway component PulF
MTEKSGMNGEGSGGGLSGPEAFELSEQLSRLARAGLPLGPSLAAMAEELPGGRLRRSMRYLARGLESGQLLDEAVEGRGGGIPPHLRGLMMAGIRSGRLGEVLGEFSEYTSVGIELRRRLWLNLAYPILTVAIMLGVFAFVSIAVVPQFESIFRDFGVPLPRVTHVVFAMSAGTSSLWPTLAVVGVVAAIAMLGSRLFLRPATARSLATFVPLLGGVWRWTSLAEFCHLLALLLEHRLPMPEALRLAGEGVQDARIESTTRSMAEAVEDGKTLAQAMASRGGFPPRLPRLLRWAENQGSLPEVLHMAGDMFAARASAHSSLAASVLSVACFILIIVGVNLVILGLMLPMINLISKLSG